MNRIIVVISWIFILVSPAVASAVPFTPCLADICESGPGGDIDHLGGPDLVSRILTIGDHGFITDLDLSFEVTGPFSSDISFSITHESFTVDLGNPLSVFYGMDIFGDWTLLAEDRLWPQGNEGNHFEWRIAATLDTPATIPNPEPGTFLLMMTGLLGLVAYNQWRKYSA